MSELIKQVANAIADEMVKLAPAGLTDEDCAKLLACAAILAMRELPSDPGPRYTAGEYSSRTQEAMVDEALGIVE